MKCRVIQSISSYNNKAEEEMSRFLRGLPEGYFVYRELKLDAIPSDKLKGVEQKQPDFVVVAPQLGVMSIEVKDWDLDHNVYEWRDQYEILRTPRGSNEAKPLTNPAAQADAYLRALIELLKPTGVFIASIVAFPRITRQGFLNKISQVELLKNPQSRFLLDMGKTLFKEELDEHFIRPEQPLLAIARKHSKFHPSEISAITIVNDRLLPNSFRIGGVARSEDNHARLRMISEQQERWIFNLRQLSMYLLDVVGSGKTNVLISRAIYLVEQALRQTPNTIPHVLLTTYNDNLQKNIQRIFQEKIQQSDPQIYERYITIECVPSIMERIAADAYELSIPKYQQLYEGQSDYEEKLLKDVDAALSDRVSKYQVFDHIFIDEIQDIDDRSLYLLMRLSRSKNFFFVGDVAQKILPRNHDLSRHGIDVHQIDLPKSYRMYRTPKYVGKLAHQFVIADPKVRAEFETQGYREDTTFASPLHYATEFRHSDRPATEIADSVLSALTARYTEDDVLVVTSLEQLKAHEQALAERGIVFNVGQSLLRGRVTLVDFMNVKGLERQAVFVSGMEDLYHRGKPEGLFWSVDQQVQQETLSRRKIYVALTRSLQECVVYYQAANNTFVVELLRLNRQVIEDRQG